MLGQSCTYRKVYQSRGHKNVWVKYMDEIKIKRRVSAHPLDLGITKMVAGICPDVFETELGDFVIIGRDVTPNV